MRFRCCAPKKYCLSSHFRRKFVSRPLSIVLSFSHFRWPEFSSCVVTINSCFHIPNLDAKLLKLILILGILKISRENRKQKTRKEASMMILQPGAGPLTPETPESPLSLSFLVVLRHFRCPYVTSVGQS